jgi:EF-P beta-lysylation protein EpmB
MITASSPLAQQSHASTDWRRLWREAITDAHELLAVLGLEPLADHLAPQDAGFSLRVPRGFVARMRPGDPGDPLLLQVLPQLAELDAVPGFTKDAVGDLASRAAHGVLHKYHGRALLIASGTCAINCRYCFRRHFPYGEDIAAASGWREAIEYVRGQEDVEELILSGGDPLALSTPKLQQLTDQLHALPHVRTLRLHTRLPVVLPERIDDEFMQWFAPLALHKVVVLHANHERELNASVARACARLRDCGATLLNQSVLLRGINDDARTLVALSRRLFACGVLPYYVHQLDRVQGAAHFEVSDANATGIIEDMRAHLPGYLLPRLVREVAGDAAKRPIRTL